MDKNKFSSSVSFLSILVFSVVVTIIVFSCKSYVYKGKMQTIIEMQQEDSEQLKHLISTIKVKSSNNRDFQDELISCFDAHNSKMQREMEMANADLESGIDMLALWASVITIVFLVFSIYSIFRTDEMLSNANAALDNIKTKEQTVTTICNIIETKSNSITQGISQKVVTIENQAKQLSVQLATIQRQLDTVGESTGDGNSNQEGDDITGTQTKTVGEVPAPPTNPKHPEA